MNKRIIALVMALVLCLASTAALAANSKTTYDIITTDSPVITVAAPTAESKAELDAIAKFVNDGQPVVTYFDEAVQTLSRHRRQHPEDGRVLRPLQHRQHDRGHLHDA